jgi:hypothetical protein
VTTAQPHQPPLTSGPHTDQCIRDAARYGFCDHTRLTARSIQIRIRERDRANARLSSLAPNARMHSTTRELLGWLGLLTITGSTVWLYQYLGAKALLVAPTIGLGWLLVFTCGLPKGLTADLTRALPPDAKDRLNTPPPEGR